MDHAAEAAAARQQRGEAGASDTGILLAEAAAAPAKEGRSARARAGDVDVYLDGRAQKKLRRLEGGCRGKRARGGWGRRRIQSVGSPEGWLVEVWLRVCCLGWALAQEG